MPLCHLTHRIEFEIQGRLVEDRLTILLLHHGLGSVSTWRDFPERVHRGTGLAVVSYSRVGNGRSEPALDVPPGVDFMHREARGDLPRLLRHLGIDSPILVGHSDGASIALIYAGEGHRPVPRGLLLIAPHLFVEDCTLESARKAADDFSTGSLRERMARHHDDPDGAFGRWSGAWLHPDFRRWNIEAVLARIRCPVAAVQGDQDPYGTLGHVRRLEQWIPGGADVLVVPGAGHAPHRDAPDAVIDAVASLVSRARHRGPMNHL